MATNKFAQECKDCGEMVLPGRGILTQEWSNQDDDVAWVVRHADKSICKAVEAERENGAAVCKTISAVINYIKTYGEKSPVQDSKTVIYNERKGYNNVGWRVTADADNNIYLTYRNNLDGWDLSETYILTAGEDEGFGNSNADIINILSDARNGKPAADLQPFAI